MMKNIDLTLNKPYQREPNQIAPHKVSFSAEFDDVGKALFFMSKLNELALNYHNTEDMNNA